MQKIKQKEHDFSAKIRQQSILEDFRAYVNWIRDDKAPFPVSGPISINLDLTAACNFACPHCVDSGIINTGEQLDLETIKATLETLCRHGLKSVILIGGGEPTLHPDFEEIVRISKTAGLQVGVVTNGSKLKKVAKVAHLFDEKDWVRLSLDAATEETFRASHCPAKNVTLDGILDDARALKAANPRMQLGYSFVVVWDGITIGAKQLKANVDEMAGAVSLAKEYGFDYISFKPCLIRLEGSKREALFDGTAGEEETRIIKVVSENLARAHAVADGLKVLESVNLKAMLENKVHELKKQPLICHSQFYRTVVAPAGIFHCPAFRGVEKGRLADCNGYAGEENYLQTMQSLEKSFREFDAARECDVVVCFYHHVNWWMDNFINSGEAPDRLEALEDNNFFF